MGVAAILGKLWAVAMVIWVIGLAVLLYVAVAELFITPGISLVDGYWIGRLPWTPIGVGLTLGGATATLLTGGLWLLISGPWAARLAALVGMLAGAWWWLITLVFGLAATCAPPCPRGRPEPDIITIAYSAPENPMLFVLLPALLVSLAVAASMLGLRRRSAGYISPS